MEIIDQPILITGCPRSGAGIIAAAINICGAFGGHMSKQNADFEEGWASNDHIRERLVKLYLGIIGFDLKGQYPLPTKADVLILNKWGDDVKSIMIDEGYTDGLWMCNDSRSCLIWPLWHNAFPNAKWVIVQRKDEDIIQSCIKTGFMSAFKHRSNLQRIKAESESDGWMWMLQEYTKRFSDMIAAGLNCRYIQSDQIFEKNYTQLFELLDWLGLKENNYLITMLESVERK